MEAASRRVRDDHGETSWQLFGGRSPGSSRQGARRSGDEPEGLCEESRDQSVGLEQIRERCARTSRGNSEQLKSSALTRICVLLDENPVNFLIEHPLYDGATRARMTFPKDHLYRRYNAQLKNAEALGLLPNLKRAKDLGVFEQAVAAVANVVEAAEESRATMPPLQPRPGPRDSHRSPRSSQTRRSS